MTILFYLTAFLFSLGQLGRISFFNQQINFYLYEVVLTLSLSLLFFKYHFKPIKEAWKKYKPVFFFLFILLLSLLFDWQKYSLFNNIVGFLYFFRLHLYFIYFFYLQYHIKSNNNFSKVVKKGIFMIAILTIISTLIQYFLYPDLRNLLYQGWDPHLYRTFGVFFDTSIAAAIFGIFFLTVNQPIIKVIYLILIALSFSRAIYLGLSLTLIYIFIQKKQFKKILLFLLFFIVLIFIIPKPAGEGVNLKRLYSITSRGQDYLQGINLWKNKPVLGYGYNRIRYIKNSDSVHSGATFSSSFLTILVSSGILGLLSFIWSLWSLRKSTKIAPTLLIFLSIVSLFDNILLHPFILFLLFTSLSDK
ncbi:MAG TPA: O-antigen ligase family protein [Patescibacteria group bacterium]